MSMYDACARCGDRWLAEGFRSLKESMDRFAMGMCNQFGYFKDGYEGKSIDKYWETKGVNPKDD